MYLDYNATTPVDETVLATMLPYFTQHFGNAASAHHSYGLYAEAAVKFAREQVAKGIGAVPEEIIFTSGATEGLNFVLRGIAKNYVTKGNHFVTVSTEHKAVLETLNDLESQGITQTVLKVDKDGLINLSELENSITPKTIAVCIMWANNETGVWQDIPKIAAICKEKGVLFVSDATQALGKVPISVTDIDVLIASGHKLYAPKGIGFVYLRRKNPRVMLPPFVTGGGQERGLRGGTTNVPLIVGLGKAVEIAVQQQEAEAHRQAVLVEIMEKELQKAYPKAKINGANANRLPNTLNICFEGQKSAEMFKQLRQIALSGGSACSSKNQKPSHVLTAMGLSEEDAKASIRISVGRYTTVLEIETAIKAILEALVNP